LPAKKPAATAGILRRILAPIAAALAGLRLTLPHPKGERTRRGVTVAIPHGSTELCPVRALRHRRQAAEITEGPVFRRIWIPPRGRDGRNTPCPASAALLSKPAPSPGSFRTVLPALASTPSALGGHSLKRGALSNGIERGVAPVPHGAPRLNTP